MPLQWGSHSVQVVQSLYLAYCSGGWCFWGTIPKTIQKDSCEPKKQELGMPQGGERLVSYEAHPSLRTAAPKTIGAEPILNSQNRAFLQNMKPGKKSSSYGETFGFSNYWWERGESLHTTHKKWGWAYLHCSMFARALTRAPLSVTFSLQGDVLLVFASKHGLENKKWRALIEPAAASFAWICLNLCR